MFLLLLSGLNSDRFMLTLSKFSAINNYLLFKSLAPIASARSPEAGYFGAFLLHRPDFNISREAAD
jgi:hypothetical protein